MTASTTLNAWAPRVLSITRIMSGLLLLAHGTAKFLNFPPLSSLPGIAGVIELVCGVLIALGLFTRPAAFLASGMTAFAYFIAHFPKNFFPVANGGDAAVLFCFIFLYFIFAGAGPWSIDAQRGR